VNGYFEIFKISRITYVSDTLDFLSDTLDFGLSDLKVIFGQRGSSVAGDKLRALSSSPESKPTKGLRRRGVSLKTTLQALRSLMSADAILLAHALSARGERSN
jgi:hypothetical protein